MRISDWSSDVCSSDLVLRLARTLSRQRQRQKYQHQGQRRRITAPGELGAIFRVVGLDQRPAALGVRGILVLVGLHAGQRGIVDRKSVWSGTRVSVRVDPGGRRIFKKKKNSSII